MEVKIDVLGLPEAMRELRQLEPRLQKNVLRGAIRKLATETRDAARARLPVDTGNLRRNVVSKGRRIRRFEVGASVVVREELGERVMSRSEWRRERFKGAKAGIKNAFYWRFVEYGTRFMPARPFLRKALESVRSRADLIMASYMRGRVDKALQERRIRAIGKR